MSTSKDHIDYWKTKLRKQKIPRCDWEGCGRNQNWEVYLQYRGVREWFNLQSANKDVAATKAREIWRAVVGGGWDSARAQFKPTMTRTLKCPTVGEYLAAVQKYSTLREHTAELYALKLRTLIAEMRGIEFSSAAGGHDGRRHRVEETKLSALTLPSIQEWKKKRLRAAGENPLAVQKTKRTINSILRNARSLFSRKLLKVLPIQWEGEIPFGDVPFERAYRVRYRSKVNVRELLRKADAELAVLNVEAYKIFLLALTAGLRRREIDGLTWDQIDFEAGTIRIETNAHTELKSEDSQDSVDLCGTTIAVLSKLRQTTLSDFVIAAPQRVTGKTRAPTYRCDESFEFLIEWLRSNGVSDDKPIHALRKEFGSYISAHHGLYAASSALRHSNIQTTREYYLDKKTRTEFNPQLPDTSSRISSGAA